jgi:DNA polymerase delta subunit 1
LTCTGRKGKFPEPEIDPVISIGCVLSLQGQTEPLARVIFQLNTCANIPGVAVYSFADETSLLTSWRRFVIHSDPDLLIGYNIVNFDLWYLIKRAAALKIDEFCLLSRLRDCRSKVSEKTFQSKAFGKRENKDINIEGRVQFDMYACLLIIFPLIDVKEHN